MFNFNANFLIPYLNKEHNVTDEENSDSNGMSTQSCHTVRQDGGSLHCQGSARHAKITAANLDKGILLS